ncbi:MAG: acetyltransferase [Planctomycetota bacterium]
MSDFDVFNGDADGICALHQLRLAEPRQSTLVTGVKRDIQLLRRVQASAGDRVTVLDISLDKNRDGLIRLIGEGAEVQYFDHHYAGNIPESDQLAAHINTDGNVCTGWLVNEFLNGAHLPWAVTALFGDNLHDAAHSAAQPLGLSEAKLEQLKELGTLLNYNGYGSTLEDLFFAPEALYRKVQPYADPFEFIRIDQAFETLSAGYQSDMRRAAEIEPRLVTSTCAAFVFPEDAFARRVSGVYSNQLARDNPSRAHALLSLLPSGDYLVSVRAPLETKTGADELCRQFPTGGGRKAAAGINQLPAASLQNFLDTMQAQFERSN